MKEFERSYWARMAAQSVQRRELLRGALVSGAGMAALGLIGCGGGSKSAGIAGDKGNLVTQPADSTKRRNEAVS